MSHPIPDGHHSITPHLVIKGASDAIAFYQKAFGAKEIYRMPMPGPDGAIRLMHAEIEIGDSKVFIADEFPEWGSAGPGASSPVTIHLYVTDADATFALTLEHGDDSGLSDTAAPATTDLIGTLANGSFQFDSDNKCRKIGYIGAKRYVRATVTPSNNTGNLFLAGVAVLGHPKSAPTAAVPA